MNKYLVFNSELIEPNTLSPDHLYIVNAENPESAKEKYNKRIYREDEIIKFVNSKCRYEGFYGGFSYTDEDLNKYNSTGRLVITDEDIKTRIKDFFKNKNEFAELYIEYLFFHQEASLEDKIFPDELYWFVWNKSYSNKDVFSVIPITKIQEIS